MMQRKVPRLNASRNESTDSKSRAITFLNKRQDEGGIKRKSEQVRATWQTEKLTGRKTRLVIYGKHLATIAMHGKRLPPKSSTEPQSAESFVPRRENARTR